MEKIPMKHLSLVALVAAAALVTVSSVQAQTAKQNKKSMGTSSAPGPVYYDMWINRTGTREGKVRTVRGYNVPNNPVIFWDFQDRSNIAGE
jgi:hypothetical protein